eukprot:scaffold42575_cov31-Tisochrysis_lutea.AAC.2
MEHLLMLGFVVPRGAFCAQTTEQEVFSRCGSRLGSFWCIIAIRRLGDLTYSPTQLCIVRPERAPFCPEWYVRAGRERWRGATNVFCVHCPLLEAPVTSIPATQGWTALQISFRLRRARTSLILSFAMAVHS